MTNLAMRYLLPSINLIKSQPHSVLNRAMTKLEIEWINEIHESRLVILPEEDSYLSGIDIPVWKIIRQVADGLTEAELIQAYPDLTEADIRVCSLFVYLRITGKL